MSYQWLEASVTHHREVLMQEAEQERLIGLARRSRKRTVLAPRVLVAQALRGLATLIEPRERATPAHAHAHAAAQGCAGC